MPLLDFFTRRYTRQGLWTLFLMCAFPLHLWTLILVFRDMSWVTERTNAWDAVGVASYGMLFAFFESVAMFLVFALLGYLVPKFWGNERQIALMSVLMLVASLWAMAGQLYFLTGFSFSGQVIHFFVQQAHPLRMLYIVAMALVGPTVLASAWLVLRSDKFLKSIQSLIERFTLLTMFYLLFDLIGLVIVIIRNVG